MYCTVEEVQLAAGIVGNTNITVASIQTKITMADSLIRGKLADVYVLPLAETPALLKELSRELAAGWVLIDEYGKEAQGTDKDGYRRIERIINDKGTGILDRIQKKEIKLISDTTSQELAVARTRSASFRPNNLSEEDSDPDVNTSPHFRINKTF